MNVAILHCHLNRGGVTSVITNHVRALDSAADADERLRVAILFDGQCAGWNDALPTELQHVELSLHVLPSLGYDDRDAVALPQELSADLMRLLHGIGFTAAETVLHVHNHSLGKNVSLPGAMTRLSDDGFGVLLQIHDFAEDGRPRNYVRLTNALAADAPRALPGLLYPQSPAIHYAVLNRRDEAILLEAGVEKSRLHLLPNPIHPFGELPPQDAARERLAELFGIRRNSRLALSPVRGIRRKNIGETLLWSALSVGALTCAVTLPPLNPVEQPSYQRWQELASSLGLAVVFEIGAAGSGMSFLENLAAADVILTTSVAEGFGLAYLESWLAGRPLIGRDLPEITADFKAAGIDLSLLSPELQVPLEDVGATAFCEHFESAWRRSSTAYCGDGALNADLRPAVRTLTAGGFVDFGRLGASLQRGMIEKAVRDPNVRRRIRERNPWMDAALSDTARTATIDQNTDVILQQYSVAGCGKRLRSLYVQVLNSRRGTVVEPIVSGGRILDEFLQPLRFHPIRIDE